MNRDSENMECHDETQDPRVRRTRTRLQSALIELLSEKPFQSITVQDITDRADVNRATFYAHFTDKYALLNQVAIDMLQQELMKRLPEHPAFSLDNLRALLMGVCSYMRHFSSKCSPAQDPYRPMIETEIQKHLSDMLQRWLEVSDIDLESPDVTSAALSWVIFGVALQWSRKEWTQPLEAVADQVMPMIAAMLDKSAVAQNAAAG